MTIVPAYGRDYKSAKEVKEAWNQNKDFIIASIGISMGRFINKSDAYAFAMTDTIMVRYANQKKIVQVYPETK